MNKNKIRCGNNKRQLNTDKIEDVRDFKEFAQKTINRINYNRATVMESKKS